MEKPCPIKHSKANVARDLMYLQAKPVLMDNPGTRISSIYYNKFNTTVEAVEATFTLGKLESALAGAGFGSTGNVAINHSDLLGEMYVHLELAPLVANQTLCRGWGYACLESINYTVGSGGQSNVLLTGQGVLQKVMLQMQNEEKRSEVFRLGGEALLSPTTDNPCADIIIPLPWSSASGMYSKLPFDTGLLSSPITIQIKFKQNNSIYGGTGIRPTTFLAASATFRQGKLKNPDQSVAGTLQQFPSIFYKYPFIHTGEYSLSSLNSGGNKHLAFTLDTINDGDLLAISLGVIKSERVNPVGSNSPSPFRYDSLKNIVLKDGGQNVWKAPGNSYKLSMMSSRTGSMFFKNDVIASGTVAPFTSVPVDTYILHMSFSRIDAITFDKTFQNVWRLPRNSLTIEFDVEDANTIYDIHACYYYNDLLAIKSNGQTQTYQR